MPWEKGGKLWSPLALKKPVEPTPGRVTTIVYTKYGSYTVTKAADSSSTPNTDKYVSKFDRRQQRREEKERKRLERIQKKRGISVMDTRRSTLTAGHSIYSENYRNEDDDEYYVPEKKEFAWSATRWSSYNWSTWYDSGTVGELYVKNPDNYITPTEFEIKGKINVYTNESVELVQEICRVCYLKMIDDKDYMSKRMKNNEGGSTYEKKKKIFDDIYNTYIPGFSPLEQALAVYHRVRDAEAREQMAKRVGKKDIHRNISFKREDYGDESLMGQFDHCAYSRKSLDTIMQNISIMGDMGSHFKVELETGEKEVENSIHVKKQIMRSYDQITKIDIYQRLLPYYGLKLLTKELVVNVPISKTEKKQTIIIICDYSGSMHDPTKQVWVNSILMDRFRHVIRGNAEIYFSYFVSNPEHLKFTHLKCAADVKSFWKNFSNSPNGSLTDMGRIVTHISDEIKRGSLCNLKTDLSKVKPEILIINDGQDSVGYDAFPYKVNAISLMEFSDELKNLCVNSGGKQIMIDNCGNITGYTTEGMFNVAKGEEE